MSSAAAVWGETNPPTPEVSAAYVEFLELLEQNVAPPIEDFIERHPECDSEELRLYLEAIVQVDGIAPSHYGAEGLPRSEDDPSFSDPRYRVEGVIGRGGMGVVFCVYDRDMDRRVAMKVVRRFPLAVNQHMQQLFLEEVMTSARLEHPSIVPIYEWGMTTDERLYYTMRWVRGKTLGSLLADLAAGDPAAQRAYGRIRLLQIFYQLALGVAYAHEQGIAHQDLKPANVMIGEFGEVLTLDWGLARPIGAAIHLADSSRETVVGTPGYMAPEQIRKLPVDARSDVFALGAILYESLTLARAFPPGAKTGEVLDRTLSGEYVDPRSHPPAADLSDQLVAILKRALEAEPGRRYATARPMAEEVFEVIEGARETERRRALAGIEVARGLELAGRYHKLRDRIARWSELQARERLEVMPHWPLEQKRALWERQLRLERLEQAAAERFTRAVSAFQRALGLDTTHQPARQHLAALVWEAFLAAESRGDYAAAALYREQVRGLDDGHLAEAIAGRGKLKLEVRATRDSGVLLRELRGRGPLLEEGRIILQGQGSVVKEIELSMGRYIVTISRPARSSLRFPLHMRRQDNQRVRLFLDEMIEDPELVYIPGGIYEIGGDPEVPDAPLRRVVLESFLIGRFPVTCAQYLEYLNALLVSAPATASIRVPRVASGKPLWERGGTRRLYRLPERSTFPYYFEPDSPVVGISWLDAQGYCEWRCETDPASRRFSLPTSDEWEAAGRSADGRAFPWGDRYDPSLACNRDSHKGMSRIVGVREFPSDISAFGVRGMAGNTSDWCQDYGDRGNRQHRIVRGGHHGGAEAEARLARIQHRRPDDVSPQVGFRVRAELQARPSSRNLIRPGDIT